MQLKSVKTIKGTIKVLTGLHIGAGMDALEIGGLNQPIIKHPLTQAPYIPGSSIKGKMRAMLEVSLFMADPETKEWVTGKKDKGGRGMPCGCGKAKCRSCAIFGTAAENKSEHLGPTRLIVRDAYLTKEWEQKFMDGSLPMEIKYENTIDRVKGTAEHPRPLERVPSGVEFAFNLSFKVLEGDEPEWLNHVYQGLRLIQLDALGGNSSRGCGQVEFVDLTCDGISIKLDNYDLK